MSAGVTFFSDSWYRWWLKHSNNLDNFLATLFFHLSMYGFQTWYIIDIIYVKFRNTDSLKINLKNAKKIDKYWVTMLIELQKSMKLYKIKLSEDCGFNIMLPSIYFINAVVFLFLFGYSNCHSSRFWWIWLFKTGQ